MDKDAYRSTFIRLSGRIEKGLIRALLFLFVALIVSQFLLQYDMVRYWLSETDRLEGLLSNLLPEAANKW